MTPQTPHIPRAPRYQVGIPVRYRAIGELIWRDGTSENVSRTGVLFLPEAALSPDTPMRGVPPLGDELVSAWVAMARLVLGPHMNVQAPPNLAPTVLELLARSGLNDWGGVSPLTIDFINPEAPWPKLTELRRRTEATGQILRERLPVYPDDVATRPELFDPRIRSALPRFADEKGFARARPLPAQEAA